MQETCGIGASRYPKAMAVFSSMFSGIYGSPRGGRRAGQAPGSAEGLRRDCRGAAILWRTCNDWPWRLNGNLRMRNFKSTPPLDFHAVMALDFSPAPILTSERSAHGDPQSPALVPALEICMLCLECATRSPRPRIRHVHEPPALEGLSRLRSLVCSGCGTLLPLTDSAEGLLTKLIQLDRFGLGAFAEPLLKCSRPVPYV
jgi:hypothetical protein